LHLPVLLPRRRDHMKSVERAVLSVFMWTAALAVERRVNHLH
jgi:hypothetical protein